ncbi:MAG: YDG domain-containing protein [Candidatus Pacebacteria bacterium]|nr:YDG domain-containing protein [Candidatus Paceibacterota bacterium]
MKNILGKSNFGFTKWGGALIAALMTFVTTSWGQLTLPAGTSYTETFNSIGTALPTGWTVRTGATSSARGTSQAFANTSNIWADSGGSFKNLASANGGSSVDTTATQNARTDRALGIRQTGTFANPGGSFELELASTTGKTGFGLSIKHQMLSVQARSTTWTVQYSTTGTSWTNLGTYTDPGIWGSTTGSYSFGTAIDNLSGPVYIRVVALTASTGSSSNDTYAVDDFVLSWANASASTPPTLSAAGSATVDGEFNVTFTENAAWREAITGVTVNGTALTAGWSALTSGQITFTPSASSPVNLLQASGTKTIEITATGYSTATVSQTVNPGVATQLVVTTQPTAPTSNGGQLAAQPVVALRDKYNNTVTTSSAAVTASKGAGSWTLGGTASVTASSGVATFAGLTATSSQAVNPANIIFSSGDLSVTSNDFNIPAPTLGTYAFTGTLGSLAASGVAANVSFGNIVRNGITQNQNLANSFSGNASWGSSFNSGLYLEFTLTPSIGYALTASDFIMDVFRSSAGAQNYAIRSSADNFATDLATGTVTTSQTAISRITLSSASFSDLSGLTFRIYAWGGGSSGDFRVDNIAVRGSVRSVPTITINGALSSVAATAFSTTYGTAATAQEFMIGGTSLTGDISVGALNGFEFSTNGSTYSSTAIFPQTGGSASGTLYIRMAATAPAGSYNNQSISLTSSGGATSRTISTAASGNTVSAKGLDITGLSAQNKNWDGTTAVTVSGPLAYDGLMNGESFEVTGTVSWSFPGSAAADNLILVRTGNYDTPSANYTVTQPSLMANIIAIVPSAPTLTGITAGDQKLTVAFTAPEQGGGISITNYEFSTDGGSSWTTPNPAVTGSPLLITGLQNATPYNVKLRALNSAGSGAESNQISSTAEAPREPTLTVVPAILTGPLTTTYGSASSEQSFTVTGSTLSGDLVVTPPAGLEVSQSSSGGWADSLSLANIGSVAPTTIYVRLKATADAGNYNSNDIQVTSSGATAQTVKTSASGNTVGQAPLTITGITIDFKTYDGNTSATISGTPAYSGLQNRQSFEVTGTATATFASKNAANDIAVTVADYTAPNANYSLTQPAELKANITPKSLTFTTPSTIASRPFNNTTTAGTVTPGSLEGFVGTETVTAAGTAVAYSGSDVGSYSTDIAYTLADGTNGGLAVNYSLAGSTATAEITKADQTITFNALAVRVVGSANFNLIATANSGLAVSYTSSNPAVATVDGSTVTIVGAGSTTITASQAGNSNYNAATNVTQSLLVDPLPTSLAAGDIAVIGYNTQGTPDSFTVVFLKSLNPGTRFFVSDNEIAAADGTTFSDVAEVEATFTVKSGQSIPAGTVLTLPWGTATVTDLRYDWTGFNSGGFGTANDEIYIFTANAATDLTPTAFIYGVAIGSSPSARPQGLSQGTTFIKPTGGASRYKLSGATYSSTADQIRTAIGNTTSNWEAVAPVSTTDWSFSVLLPQTISFNSLSAVTYGDASFTLTGTSSSGLMVSYTSSNTGVATVSGGTVTIVGAGTTTITASQSGNATYAAAGTVSRNLTINKATPVLGSIPTTSAITAGQALSNSNISGGTVTPSGGTWTWSDPGNTNTVEGTNSYAAVYTPALADQGNYLNLTTDLSVRVNSAGPVGTTYSGWLISNGAGASDAAFLDYVFGAATPGTLDPSLKPTVAVVPPAGGAGGDTATLVLTYYVRQNTVGLTVTPKTSADLAAGSSGWTTVSDDEAVGSPTTRGDGVTVQMRKASVPMIGDRKFLRVEAVQR